MKFLVTGGSGYIGSHTCVELINAGYQVVILDNLSNSKKSALQGVAKITGKEVSQDLLSKEGIFFYEADIRNREVLQQIFTEHKIDVVLHFAGDKVVGDSICDPIKYYNNSLMGTVLLLEEMQKFNIKKIIYSSSATVYGNPKRVPIEENDNTGNCLNPYGRTKYFSEQILQDLYKSDPTWSIAILRYFNPVGAHPSSIIGEYPNGIPTNLMPYIAQVASGRLEKTKNFWG